jgi:hypothetical protein
MLYLGASLKAGEQILMATCLFWKNGCRGFPISQSTSMIRR